MLKREKIWGVCIGIGMLSISISYAQKPVIKDITSSVITVTPPKKHLHTLGWPNDIINSVAVKTSKGLVIIDTQSTPMNARSVKSAINEYFNDSVYVFVINTHGHSAHTAGNIVFSESQVVAQINSIEEIRNYDNIFLGQTVDYLRKKIYNRTSQLDTTNLKGELKDSLMAAIDLYRGYENDLIDNYKPRTPDVTFEDRLMLGAENTTFELFFMGSGHSNADIVVYIPEQKVLCTGNLFHLGSFDTGAMPSFYLHRTNDIEKWISTLTEVLKSEREIKYVLTTHGKRPFKKRDMEFILAYCKAVNTEVKKTKAEGGSLNDLMELSVFNAVIRDYYDVVGISKATQAMHARNMGIIWDYIK
jgi:cyclase